MKSPTLVNHPALVNLPADNYPLVEPIYQTVKFSFDDPKQIENLFLGQRSGFFYGRIANPSVQQLADTLAQVQGRDAALCVASGVAAINTVLFSLLKQGDHVLMFLESYKPTRQIVGGLLKKFGVSSTVLSILDIAGIERELQKQPTRLMIFESPTNPVLRIADLTHITRLCRRYGVVSVLDNTFAGIHNHGQFDIDVFVHSLTKFVGGHGDVLGGAIISNKNLIDTFQKTLIDVGPCMDPHAAHLFMRGLKTYFIRYERQCANAQKIAAWLEQQKTIQRVFYPGLASHPQHALAKTQMHDFGAMISVDLKNTNRDEMFNVISRLKLFQLAASLGSTESLIAPSKILYGYDLDDSQRKIAGIEETTLRLSIGIEDVDDLIADLHQALAGS